MAWTSKRLPCFDWHTPPPKARDPLFREVSNNSQPQTVAVVSVQICLRVSLIPEMFFVGHVHDVAPHEFSYYAYRCLCMCKDILGWYIWAIYNDQTAEVNLDGGKGKGNLPQIPEQFMLRICYNLHRLLSMAFYSICTNHHSSIFFLRVRVAVWFDCRRTPWKVLESVLVDLPHGDTTNGKPEKTWKSNRGNADVVEKVLFFGLEIMQMWHFSTCCVEIWEFPARPSWWVRLVHDFLDWSPLIVEQTAV